MPILTLVCFWQQGHGESPARQTQDPPRCALISDNFKGFTMALYHAV